MRMVYENVCLESLGFVLPPHVVTSEELEHRLQPLYQRLRLPPGRLELMTGIRERRFWDPHVLPSQNSILAANRALAAAEFDPQDVAALIHGSVCRDHLEPATACRVHHELNLPAACQIFDLSNACLGLLNGMLQVANMIELGQIRAGLVVGSEGSRQLVETTIEMLNRDASLSRQATKSAIASLTIGSASCAALLVHRDISRTSNRLLGGVTRAHTEHHRLCHSGRDEAVADGMRPLMQTDSEQLMKEGVATGIATFAEFRDVVSWQREEETRTVCHQVGGAHRRLMLESLGLSEEHDFVTYPWLGNTGSVALPITLAIAAETEFIGPHQQLGLLGIGSGINCVMLGVEWNQTLVCGDALPEIATNRHDKTVSPSS